SGTVTRLLSDDNDGSRHQRFIIELASGQTLLIVHNIDLAPRIDDIREGDEVRVYGEYIWNDKGGLIHWTHHDPANRHPHGWIRHQDRLYQ
ncbi:MAG TPA: DNA-binding protein, partial [Methylophaga sp.]|nr:DNA-binding protein [Methylophaga sp.]